MKITKNCETRKTGFSIIELLLAIALFCLATTLLLANFSFLHRYLLTAQVHKLYNTMLYLQRTAIATNKNTYLFFDVKNNQYCTETEKSKKTHNLPRQVIFDFIPGASGPPSSPSKPITKSVTFKKEKITFHKDGIIDAGTVYLTDSGKTYMHAISCSVSQVSYIRRYVYKNGWVLSK